MTRPTTHQAARLRLVAAWLLLAAGSLAAVPGAAAGQQDRLEYPVERTGEFVASIAASPFVSPVASARLFEPGPPTPEGLRPFTIGRTPGTARGGYRLNGDEVPSFDLYGFRVSDAGQAGGDRPAIVLISGQHPLESHSIYTLEGMIEVIADPDDPVGRLLRSRADFYVYPQVNPAGRWGRVGRSNPENPGEDNNRAWADPSGWSALEVVQRAMHHDLEGRDVLYFLDVHAPGYSSSALFHYATPRSARSPWAQFSENQGIRIELAGGGPRLAYGWSMLSRADGGLDADYGFTPEIGRQNPDAPDSYREIGAKMALALARALVAREVHEPPPPGVELRFDFDNGRVPDTDGWNVIAAPLGGNTYPLVDHRGEVLGARFTVPEGLESSSVGNWPAGTPLPDWVDPAAAEGYLSFAGETTLVLENLGTGRVFDIHIIRSQRVDDPGLVPPPPAEAGHHLTEFFSLEGARTDAEGRLVLSLGVPHGEAAGVINAMRIVERVEGGGR